MKRNNLAAMVFFMMFAAFWSLPLTAHAHCDTMDGPVVNTARMALEKGDVTPVLKWVRKNDEDEIKGQFQKTLTARKQGKERRTPVSRANLSNPSSRPRTKQSIRDRPTIW